MVIALLAVLCWRPAQGEESYQEVEVADPFIELRTGPGRGYPIFYVEERGAWITVLRRRTNWFKVRTARKIEGWVDRAQLERTLTPAGQTVQLPTTTQEDFYRRRWELGVLGGEFGSSSAVTVYGAYAFTTGMQAELSLAQVLGDFSDSLFVNGDIIAEPCPDWRISPFFAVGTGMIDTTPHAVLVQAQDRTDHSGHVGFGVRTHVSRRFMLRLEYRSHVIFASRDDNEETGEWRAGFAVFY